MYQSGLLAAKIILKKSNYVQSIRDCAACSTVMAAPKATHANFNISGANSSKCSYCRNTLSNNNETRTRVCTDRISQRKRCFHRSSIIMLVGDEEDVPWHKYDLYNRLATRCPNRGSDTRDFKVGDHSYADQCYFRHMTRTLTAGIQQSQLVFSS